jgi:Protein of unknown function (DUF1501)
MKALDEETSDEDTLTPTRRQTLLSFLFGAGAVGLRAMATGLPVWFLANPRKASAQDMACALSAAGKAQFLVVSASSAGDSISCNCPGTYTAPAVVHPMDASMAATSVTLGATTAMAAAPWAGLSAAVRARTNFFHYATGALVHGDHPKAMRLLGQTANNEMMPSIYAKHLAKCLGTVQAEPVAVGAAGNALEMISFSGRTLPTIAPLQLKQLLTGAATDPVVKLRTLRDKTLDQLNAMFKADGTPEQARFLDAMSASQTQVRALAQSLSGTLAAITTNDVHGQALAAAALISAKVTPVVTLHIPFGGDNHTDPDLGDETFDHTDHDGTGRGVPGIQAVQDALASLSLTDTTTFATMNVFGRDLSGTAKVAARGGRDHFGNHAVMVLIGKNVAPGVTGGVGVIKGDVYGATGITAATGASVPGGGDVVQADTGVSAAKTLGAALGIDQSLLKPDFNDNGAVKPVASALVGAAV